MNRHARQRTAALLEVRGVYIAGSFLSDRIGNLLVYWRLISPVNPFNLLTSHTTNAELLVASRQTFLTLMLMYGSYFLLIIPINWWYRRRGPAAYGLTRAGRPWKALILAALATAVLTQWPVLLHTLVDAIHPLGAMAPWRQAFFDMSWKRWQFWLLAGILSYAVIPVVEELIFRGYYQRRLAEDWGDGPAIIGTDCFFTFAHRQYLIANAYNITMIASLLCLAVGLGVVFAWTRSLIPSIIAHCHHQCSDDAGLARRAAGSLRYRCDIRLAPGPESSQAGLLERDTRGVRDAGRGADTLRSRGTSK